MPNLNKLGLAVLVFMALLVVAGSGTITVAGQWAGNRWIDRDETKNLSVKGAISADGTLLITDQEVKADEWTVLIVPPQVGGKVSQYDGGILLEQAKSMPAIKLPAQLSLLATPTPRTTPTTTPSAAENPTSTSTPTQQVPQPTATATPAATATTCAIKGAGDLNNDGKVDALDLVLAASQYDKLEPRVAMGRLVAVGSNYDCDYK